MSICLQFKHRTESRFYSSLTGPSTLIPVTAHPFALSLIRILADRASMRIAYADADHKGEEKDGLN